MKQRNIITVICILVMLGCGAYLLNYWNQSRTANQAQEEIAKKATPTKDKGEKTDIPIDFDALQKENSDIYAWIRIPDTEIDYPVLQNENTTELYDEFYLNHLVDKTEAIAGAIFTQRINAKDFSDGNTVLYGHNLKNKTMFTHLHDYESQEFFDKHRTIYVYTPDKVLEYEVVAAVAFSEAHLMVAYNYDTVEEAQKFVEDVKKSKGNFNKDSDFSGKDKLLTLSTCMNNNADGRYIVVAKLRTES